MDRLLSETQKNNIYCTDCPFQQQDCNKNCISFVLAEKMALAQDAKTSKWWVEKLDKVFAGKRPYFCFNEEFPDSCSECKPIARDVCAFYQYHSLKKEAGVNE